MDYGEWPLPDCINPNNFPAKLWRLVNNPANNGIFWDSQGGGIIIDKNNFEQQVLCPDTMPSNSADTFQTGKFSSFIRQLNLYGFRKIDSWDNGSCQHFSSPFFKQNHPELVPGLKRLTAVSKAKLGTQAPSKYTRVSQGDNTVGSNVKRESSFPLTPNQWKRTHLYHPKKVQPGTAHNGTPDGAALSPSVLAADKGAGVAPGCSAMHFHGLLANCENMQYKPDYFFTFSPYHLGAPKMAYRGLQTGSFSPYDYYQASHPVHMFSHGKDNHYQQNMSNQRMKKIEINLDRVFQLTDELMPAPSNRCVVKVTTPEKPNPVPVLPPRIINTSTLSGSQSSLISVLMSVSKSADVQDFVVLKPVQLPEDDITEVTSGDTKDIVVTEDPTRYTS